MLYKNQFLNVIEGLEDSDFRSNIPDKLFIGDAPMVSIWISTYNHEAYIRDCIESVIEQEISFPIEIIITDNASTDNTQAIIREYAEKYPTIIKPILGKTNLFTKNRKRFFEQLLPLARGKYLTICEGDDFWCYPHRIEEMVRFLENHPKHSLYFHSFDAKNEVNNEQLNYPRLEHDRNVGLLEVIINPHLQTASIMGRLSTLKDDKYLHEEYDAFKKKEYDTLNMLDTRLFLSFLHNGKVFGTNKVWSIYRVHSNGYYTNMIIESNAEDASMKQLKAMERCYNSKYKSLSQMRYNYHKSFNKLLMKWTHLRLEKKYIKAALTLIKTAYLHPKLFFHTYYHRYIW